MIRSLPDGIGFLVRCTYMDLNKNKLITLPSDVVNMRSIGEPCHQMH